MSGKWTTGKYWHQLTPSRVPSEKITITQPINPPPMSGVDKSRRLTSISFMGFNWIHIFTHTPLILLFHAVWSYPSMAMVQGDLIQGEVEVQGTPALLKLNVQIQLIILV